MSSSDIYADTSKRRGEHDLIRVTVCYWQPESQLEILFYREVRDAYEYAGNSLWSAAGTVPHPYTELPRALTELLVGRPAGELGLDAGLLIEGPQGVRLNSETDRERRVLRILTITLDQEYDSQLLELLRSSNQLPELQLDI